jgi:sugar-phosphatase
LYDALLADVDGTLVDSSVAVAETWREVAGRFGVDADAVLRVCHGRRDEDVVDDFFPPRTHDAVLDLIADLELKQAWKVRPVHGAAALLGAWAHDRRAAVTSGSRQLMTARLRGAGLPVPSVLVAAEDVKRGKPHPEGFLVAAERLGVPIEGCVVVEDAPAGVAAGKTAGAFVVAVASTHAPADLVDADVVVHRLADVAAALPDRGRPTRS